MALISSGEKVFTSLPILTDTMGLSPLPATTNSCVPSALGCTRKSRRLTFVRQQLCVTLHGRIAELASNQALDVEYCVGWVRRGLVLCSIAYKTLTILSPCHKRRRNAIALLIRANFHAAILPNCNAATGSKSESPSMAKPGNNGEYL